MLLQSGVLSAKKSQNNNLFPVFWHFVVVLFAKTIFLQDFALTWYWERGAGSCLIVGGEGFLYFPYLKLNETLFCMLLFVKRVSYNLKEKKLNYKKKDFKFWAKWLMDDSVKRGLTLPWELFPVISCVPKDFMMTFICCLSSGELLQGKRQMLAKKI